MSKNTFYEWVVEYLDEYGDVVDHDFCGEKFPGFPSDSNAVLVLVRDQYKPNSGDLMERGWAYFRSDAESINFDSGHPIPKRFLAAVSAANTA